MDYARKSKLFAAFVFAFIVLIYAAVAPLGYAQENIQETQINNPVINFLVPLDVYTFTRGD